MPRRLKVLRRALVLLLGAALVHAPPAAAAPARKKAPATAPVKAAAPWVVPEITCGPPLVVEKETRKGKLMRTLGRGPKLPDTCVIARFKDPAFPVADPNAAGKSVGLFGGSGPVEARWLQTLEQIQPLVDEIAKYGPPHRPMIHAQVVLSSMPIAEAHAVYAEKGGKDPKIVLSTKLIQSLRDLSAAAAKDSTDDPDTLAQEYLQYIVAHEYAHLALNHPQALDKAQKKYQQIGQALALAGMTYAVVNQVRAGQASSYAEQDKMSKQSAAVLLGATFVGSIASTEGTRFIFPIFNRSVERDADLMAVDMLERAGTNPLKGVTGLQIFYDQNKKSIAENGELSAAAKQSVALATTQIVGMAPALFDGDKEEVQRRLKMLAITMVADFALRKLEEHRMMVDAHLHDDPDDRQDLVELYDRNFYGPDRHAADHVQASGDMAAMMASMTAAAPPAPAKPLPKVDFKKIGAEVDGYVATENAKRAMAKGDMALARKEIDKALKSPIKASIDVQRIAGGVAQAEGQQDVAIKHFRAVLAAGFNATDVFFDIVRSQRIKGDNASALKTLAEGAAKTGAPEDFILERIEVHLAMKDLKAVAADVETCRSFKDPALTRVCEGAAAPPPPPPAKVA